MAKPWNLFERTAKFAVECVQLCEELPPTPAARDIAGQLCRASSSVGSNYRAARRARSDAEFIAKLGYVIEEADESMYWLEHLTATGISAATVTEPLRQEANELVAIFTAAHKTAKANLEAKKNRKRKRRRPKGYQGE